MAGDIQRLFAHCVDFETEIVHDGPTAKSAGKESAEGALDPNGDQELVRMLKRGQSRAKTSPEHPTEPARQVARRFLDDTKHLRTRQ